MKILSNGDYAQIITCPGCPNCGLNVDECSTKKLDGEFVEILSDHGFARGVATLDKGILITIWGGNLRPLSPLELLAISL